MTSKKAGGSSSAQNLRRSSRNVASATAAGGLEEQRQHASANQEVDPLMAAILDDGPLSEQDPLDLPEFTIAATDVDANASFDVRKYSNLSQAPHDVLTKVPEQNVAFAKLATSLNLSA